MKRQDANDNRLRNFGSAEYIAFVCECEDEKCMRSVLLSPGAFEARREHGEAVLYEGHVPLLSGAVESQ